MLEIPHGHRHRNAGNMPLFNYDLSKYLVDLDALSIGTLSLLCTGSNQTGICIFVVSRSFTRAWHDVSKLPIAAVQTYILRLSMALGASALVALRFRRASTVIFRVLFTHLEIYKSDRKKSFKNTNTKILLQHQMVLNAADYHHTTIALQSTIQARRVSNG